MTTWVMFYFMLVNFFLNEAGKPSHDQDLGWACALRVHNQICKLLLVNVFFPKGETSIQVD